MSLFEFAKVRKGFKDFNSSGEEEAKPPTDEQFYDALDRLEDALSR